MPTVTKPFANNTLPVYVYEGFSYTISNPIASPASVVVSNSGGLPLGYFTSNATSVTFSTTAASNILTPGTTEAFSIQVTDASGTIYTSSNSVPIGAGRFLDVSGNSAFNNSYTFYNQEPIPKVRLVAPFNLASVVTTVPSLPPGLSFYVSGSNADLSGTPLTTASSSNYLIIGTQSNGSKIVTTSNTFAVSNARILYNLSGTPIVSNMVVGSSIDARVLTAQFPPYPSGGVLRYTWPTLPDGIRVYDSNSNDVTACNAIGFNTYDASHAIRIAGAPTSNAAYAFVKAGTGYNTSNAYTFQGVRVSPLPTITSNISLTFSFAETVLFDLSTLPTFYSQVPIDSSANFFRAQTYFATGAYPGISNIFSPDLRSDLSLVFHPLTGRANVVGTPTNGAGTGTYTVRAVNSNGVTRDYLTTISVQNDSVSFVSPTPATDTCYNFILSRPATLAKTGYYPSNIQFVASAASGLPVTLAAPALDGTGLSLSNGFITGTPATVTSLSTLAVNATVTGSPATATRNVKFAVLDDAFTFGNVASSNFAFAQNTAITPFQIPVTTLSERPVTGYVATGLPNGLRISPAGVISGTPTSTDVSGTIEITPTTGYSSGSNFYTYTLLRDAVLFLSTPSKVALSVGDTANIQIKAASTTGITGSNYTQTLDPKYGITINSNTGLVSGTLIQNLSNKIVLPASADFQVTAKFNGNDVSHAAHFTTSNAYVQRAYMTYYTTDNGLSILQSDGSANNWYWFHSNLGKSFVSDFQARIPPSSNVYYYTPCNTFIGVTSSNTGGADGYRIAPDGGNSNYSNIVIAPGGTVDWGSVTYATPRSRWYAAGVLDSNPSTLSIFKSGDDGLTWSSQAVDQPPFQPRHRGSASSFSYLRGGYTLRALGSAIYLCGAVTDSVSNSVYVAFPTSDPSANITWLAASTTLGSETADVLCNANGQLVSVGSSRYRSSQYATNTYTGAADTILCATNVATGAPDVITYVIGSGGTLGRDLLAAGLDGSSFTPVLRYSTDSGSNWSNCSLGETLFSLGDFTVPPEFPIGPMYYDQIANQWNVFARLPEPVVGSNHPYSYRVFQHSGDSNVSLASNWTMLNIDNSSEFSNKLATYISGAMPPAYVQTDVKQTSILLDYNGAVTQTGPTFTMPSKSFLLYNQIPIDAINITTTSAHPPVALFASGNLPNGLTFDPVKGKITGTPSAVGTSSTTIYAEDLSGLISSAALSFNVIQPTILRKQDGAGAYTSLLRQYTEVLGAQNARDNRVLPNQDRMLGEFMSPDAPDVVTQTIDPKCRNPAC